jgi:hypothetical protein
MAAQAHNMSLAEKARAEVEAMQRARRSATIRTSHRVRRARRGHRLPDATRLVGAIRGVMEQPGPATSTTRAVGAERSPIRWRAEPRARAGALFRSALASTIANRIATGKTNAAQLAQAGDRINETALTNQAAKRARRAGGEPIIAAVAGKVREPFKSGAQGQVLNEETGDVNETALAQAAARSPARARRPRARGRPSSARARRRNTSQAGLADARKAAVKRGETNKGGARVTPQQVERWVSEVARKEWDTIPARERKGMNYQQHLDKVRERFVGNERLGGIDQDSKDALDAINAARHRRRCTRASRSAGARS